MASMRVLWYDYILSNSRKMSFYIVLYYNSPLLYKWQSNDSVLHLNELNWMCWMVICVLWIWNDLQLDHFGHITQPEHYQKTKTKNSYLHHIFNRVRRMTTLRTLRRPTSCRCCTFLPGSVKSRKVELEARQTLVGEKVSPEWVLH